MKPDGAVPALRRASMTKTAARGSESAKAGILAAALSCFVRAGLPASRVEDILSEAKVARSTFYRYFSSIDDLVINLLVEASVALMEEAVAASSNAAFDIPGRLARIAAEMVNRRIEPPIYRLVAESGTKLRYSNLMVTLDDVMQRLEAPLHLLLEGGRAAGVLRKDVTTEELAAWLQRNIANLNMVPPVGATSRGDIEAYIRIFVIPGMLAPALLGALGLTDKIIAISEAVTRIEVQTRPHIQLETVDQ